MAITNPNSMPSHYLSSEVLGRQGGCTLVTKNGEGKETRTFIPEDEE